MRRDETTGQLALADEQAAEAPVFGYFWETVHLRTGDVVGEGFSRMRPQLREQPGYGHRLFAVVELHREEAWTPTTPNLTDLRPGSDLPGPACAR